MRYAATALFVTAALALAGCTTAADLEPAPRARAVAPQPEKAAAQAKGVRMVAQTSAWPEALAEPALVTPIRLRIVNQGDRPLRISYDQFQLVGPDGTRYRALSPYAFDGEVGQPTLADVYAPIAAPEFYYDGFRVSPYYSSVYPGLAAYPDPFYYDPLYYDTYYMDTWEGMGVPQDAMLARVLPEGVIDPGGSVEGFLYFEQVPASQRRVRLRAELVHPRTNDRFGAITIPFVVENRSRETARRNR
jgi:hypothetical protein